MPLKVMHDVPWLLQPNRVELVASRNLPPEDLITSAFVLAFDQGALLMTRLAARGWQIPGGHLNPGEKPSDAARRECREETGAVVGSLALIGYERLTILAPRPATYLYPYPDSYQVFYAAVVTELAPFAPTAESLDRRCIPPDQWPRHEWVCNHRALVEEASEAAAALAEEVRRRSDRARFRVGIDQVVEERIREAQERGDFSDLPGKGKPLDLSEDNPLVPPEVRLAHGILANAGVAPDWVELSKEIDRDLARCRHLLSLGRQGEGESLLAETVAKVRLLNLKVPSLSLQRPLPRLEDLMAPSETKQP